MPQKFICGTFLVLIAAAAASGAEALEPERLPSGVAPIHYDLALVPDATHLTFRGQVRIAIDVNAATSAIVLNADELTLDKAALDGKESSAVSLDTKLQRATLTFAQAVGKGRHMLAIDYHGAIGLATQGFFAMDYDTPAGKRRTIATNFEPASERRFMPSWDEPEFKATFSISVDVPPGLRAIANMPIVSTETLANGQKRVHFATTPKMSTYLLFLGIGDFERIATQSDGTEVGVVVNRGDSEKGRYALGEAARLLHYYNEYFGFHYPLPKLGLIVAPGDIAGGSMENWGAIFYGQEDLLFDPKSSTEADRQNVFRVVAHEMAHQWFGDLVTMAWWDNLWLNEGFARWMQSKAADDLHPDWETGLQALAVAEAGKRADAKPSTHPIVQPVLTASQAEQAFDNITYDKGATVIGMLEAYVGPAAFRDGVRRYMQAHAYGNTVDADLWREVQAVAGKPVLDVEADFTRQPGVPLLTVESEQTNGAQSTVLLSQGRFAEDPSTIASAPVERWRIPVVVTAGAAPTTQLISGPAATTLAVQGTGPVIVNAGQSSFVRTLYPQAMIQALSAHIAAVKSTDQLGILYDAWALGQSGYAPITNYLELTRDIPLDADPVVWRQIVSTLVSVDRFYGDNTGHAAFIAYARDKLHPLAARLGWDAQSNEEPNAATLRDAGLVALSRFGDTSVIAEARRRFDTAQRSPGEVAPTVRRTALSIVARHADGKTLDKLIMLYRATQDPLEKQNILEALAGIADPSGAQRVLELAAGPEAPAGTANSIFRLVSREHPDLAWSFALHHVDQPGFPMDPFTRLSLMPRIASQSSDPKRAADLQTYAEQRIPASARQNVVSAISTINLNVRFRAKSLPEIDAWLSKNAGVRQPH
jgi:aminopeptidase N